MFGGVATVARPVPGTSEAMPIAVSVTPGNQLFRTATPLATAAPLWRLRIDVLDEDVVPLPQPALHRLMRSGLLNPRMPDLRGSRRVSL